MHTSPSSEWFDFSQWNISVCRMAFNRLVALLGSHLRTISFRPFVLSSHSFCLITSTISKAPWHSHYVLREPQRLGLPSVPPTVCPTGNRVNVWLVKLAGWLSECVIREQVHEWLPDLFNLPTEWLADELHRWPTGCLIHWLIGWLTVYPASWRTSRLAGSLGSWFVSVKGN